MRDSPAKLGIPPAGPIPLLRIVERAYSAGSYPALWLIEGLGHDWASRARELGHPLEDLLARGEAAHLPEETLTMMHAGIGLSFAEFLLPRLTPLSAPQTFREVLGEFAGLCARNSRPGYEGAALESLGLVTRVWHPELRDLVDCALTRDFPHLRSFFWHGVGRALFFNPVYLLPGLLSPWREAAAAADPVARLNMRAGLAWAFTLVNMREPEIVEDFVREHGEELERDGGFANGVASTLTMRHDITPQDASLDGLLAHRPAPAAAMHWERLVRGPARAAVERYQPVLRRCRALEQVFHFAALPEVVRRLERSCSAA